VNKEADIHLAGAKIALQMAKNAAELSVKKRSSNEKVS
jgi:hypothetical protein